MPEIRKIEIDDFKYLLIIESESFDSGYSPYFIKMIPILYGNTSFIAVKGRSAQGYVMAALEQGNPHRAWLMSLAVRPKYRGFGLGERLMCSLLATLKDLMVEEVVLTVSAGNTKAISLYKKLGFREEKLVEAFYGSGEDRLIMKKDISC